MLNVIRKSSENSPRTLEPGPDRPIIIFLHHGLGDLIMAIPLLRGVIKIVQRTKRITVFLKSFEENEILDLAGLSDSLEVQLFDRQNVKSMILMLRKSEPEILLAPQSLGGWRMPLMSRLIGPDISVGPSGFFSVIGFNRKISRPYFIHKVEYYLKFLKVIQKGQGSLENDIRIIVPLSLREETLELFPQRRIPARWIVFAPGSGELEMNKRWPLHNYGDLGRKLLQLSEDIRLLILGSPPEQKLVESVFNDVGNQDGRCFFAAPKRIKYAVALIEGATCLISGCSGAAHMAATLDVPIVGLFGPTNPGFTGPYTKKLFPIRSGISCSPCYHHQFISGCERPVCMEGIYVEQVFKAVQHVLNGGKFPPVPWIPTRNAKKHTLFY